MQNQNPRMGSSEELDATPSNMDLSKSKETSPDGLEQP
jgi:hypothetical protein